MKRAGTEQRNSASLSVKDTHGTSASGGQIQQPYEVTKASTSSSGTAVTVFSRPAPGPGEQASSLGALQGLDDRRETWIDRGKLPSFEFKTIDDEQVLAVVAAQRGATEAGARIRRVPDEEARRLTGIAAAIQKNMEDEVAFILTELAGIPATTNAVLSAKTEASAAFSHFIKHFRNAKLAAGDNMPAQMTSELVLAQARLASFSEHHMGPTACKPLATRASGKQFQSALERLLAACATWAYNASPTYAPVAAPGAESACDTKHVESEARTRSVSSPEPTTKRASVHEKTPVDYSGSSPTSKRTPGRKATEGPEKPSSPTAVAGRKLKALFSRSSEPRVRQDDGGDVDSNPRSPRNRSASIASTARPNTVASMPDPISRSQDSAVTGPFKGPRKAEGNHDADH